MSTIQQLRRRRFERSLSTSVTPLTVRAAVSKPSRMKIVYVANRVDPCGGVRIIFEHVNRLSDMGHDVTLMSSFPRPTWHDVRARYLKIPFHGGLADYLPVADVVVATYWDQIRDLGRAAPVAYFEQGDGHLFAQLDASQATIVRDHITFAHDVWTVSRASARALQDRFDVDATVIPNGIDLDLFRPLDGNRTGRRVCIMGSAAVQFKGIDTLLRVFERMRTRHRDLRLTWISPEVPQIATPQSVDVLVSPPQGRLAEALRASDLLMSASAYEAFSLPPLEAMASGVPVVSYANDGVKSYATHDVNALLVEIGDEDGLLEAAERVLNDSDLAQSLRLAGLTTAERHDWSTIMSDIERHLATQVGSVESPGHEWELSVAPDDFDSPEAWNTFHQRLLVTRAATIEVPVIAEGPPGHFIARWETVATSSAGRGSERVNTPLPGSVEDPLQRSLASGDAMTCLSEAQQLFRETNDHQEKLRTTFWMLMALIELGEDEAAGLLSTEALAAYPDTADMHYIAGAIASLTGDDDQAGVHRSNGLLLGPATDNESFLFNVTELLERLPQGSPERAASEPRLISGPVEVRFREHHGMYGAYVGNETMLVHTQWGGRLRIPSNDLSVGPILVTDGIYEPGLTRFLIGALGPGSTYVDAGANLGVFTVLAGLLVGATGRVVAIEANPELAQVVETNIAMNYVFDRASVRQIAISNESGSATLIQTGNFLGESSIIPADRDYRGELTAYEVETRTLDDILSDIGEIDVLKIDIEGYEPEAFEGGTDVLSRTTWVVFEWNRTGLGAKSDLLMSQVDEMLASGAKLGILENDGSVRLTTPREAFAPDFRHGLVLKLR